jgi:two-component system, NtrC family, nitrogen regulation response regulator GlnG
MPSDRTVPIERGGRMVRTLRVEVCSGPDSGRTITSDTGAISVGTADGNDLVLTDNTVSRFHLELRRQAGRILAADLGSTNGTRIGSAVLQSSSATVDPKTTLAVGATTLRVDDGDIVQVGEAPARLGDFLGQGEPVRRLMAQASRVASSDVSVLVLGESGTGKELIARALHDASPRAAEPFVTVDCGAITPTLFSSELFGHERGAFTGAERQHIGAFERAHGGTLFLDEIGDMSAALQTRLLRVLAEGEFYRVGGQTPVRVDVRVIAATNQDLAGGVAKGSFREDLFHRLNVMRITIPPLRERREDIPLLLEHYLRKAADELSVAPKRISGEAVERLGAFDWPGNVRQLVNTCRRLTVVAPGREIRLTDLPPEVGGAAAMPPSPAAADWTESLAAWADARLEGGDGPLLDEALAAFERTLIEVAMSRSGGRRQDAARLLGWGRNTLARKIRELGLDLP